MTLATKRAIQRVFLMERGFGPDIMGLIKVCPQCGRGNPSARENCGDCGTALGDKTLLDLYRSRHTCCPNCGLAVTRGAVYCPECGTHLRRGRAVV